MSARAQKLQPAIDQARQYSEEALEQLAAQQQRLAKAEYQLEELRSYRQEYAAAGDGVMAVGALLNRQKFVERIDQAVAQQLVEISRLQRQLEQVRRRWHQAHARESALGSVIDRYREQERQAEDRREQSDSDERSQYRHSRR